MNRNLAYFILTPLLLVPGMNEGGLPGGLALSASALALPARVKAGKAGGPKTRKAPAPAVQDETTLELTRTGFIYRHVKKEGGKDQSQSAAIRDKERKYRLEYFPRKGGPAQTFDRAGALDDYLKQKGKGLDGTTFSRSEMVLQNPGPGNGQTGPLLVFRLWE
jgi:hypothetical protein